MVPSTSQDQQNAAWDQVKKLVEEDIEKKSKASSHQLVMSGLSNSDITGANGNQDEEKEILLTHPSSPNFDAQKVVES